MSLQTKELTHNVSPLMVVMLQNEQTFSTMAAIANQHNYLFHLAHLMFERRLGEFGSPKTQADFMLGVAAYQAISMAAHPEQPTFTVPPDTTAALTLAGKLGGQKAEVLLDTGISAIPIMEHDTPLLAEATDEIVGRYVTGIGSKRIALGGAAAMLAAHVAAEDLLVA